jgi:hypothetical protein
MTFANKELKMPAHYVDMSTSEMEFNGGGWSWKKFFVAVTIVSAVVMIGGAGIMVGAFIAGGGLAVSGTALVVGTAGCQVLAAGMGIFGVGIIGQAATTDLSEPAPQ